MDTTPAEPVTEELVESGATEESVESGASAVASGEAAPAPGEERPSDSESAAGKPRKLGKKGRRGKVQKGDGKNRRSKKRQNGISGLRRILKKNHSGLRMKETAEKELREILIRVSEELISSADEVRLSGKVRTLTPDHIITALNLSFDPVVRRHVDNSGRVAVENYRKSLITH